MARGAETRHYVVAVFRAITAVLFGVCLGYTGSYFWVEGQQTRRSAASRSRSDERVRQDGRKIPSVIA